MIDENIIEGLREYLKDHYVPLHESTATAGTTTAKFLMCESFSRTASESVCKSVEQKFFRKISDDASDYIKKHRKPGGFAHALDRKREEKGLTPAELYKKANIDRRQYSRFMGPEGRHPSMNTVISFALALRLDRQEFDGFLKTAGYALNNSSSRDVCIMYCLENSIYNIDEVNALLFAVGIEPLSRE